MAIVNITSSPYVPTRPSFVINYDESHASGADGVQLNCALQDLVPEFEDQEVEVDTACDPEGIAWGTTAREYVAMLRMSPELWGLLKPFEKSDVTFTFLPKYTTAISATNREYSGTVRFPSVPDEVYYKKSENQLFELRLPVIDTANVAEAQLSAVFTHPLGPAT